eukprot:1386687-Lingulodinium_polyedra.AAC.1
MARGIPRALRSISPILCAGVLYCALAALLRSGTELGIASWLLHGFTGWSGSPSRVFALAVGPCMVDALRGARMCFAPVPTAPALALQHLHLSAPA